MGDMSEKWQSLQRKLRKGKSLARAAEEVGVPLAEAEALLEARRGAVAGDDDALAILGWEALHHGTKTLIALTRLGEGRASSSSSSLGPGMNDTTKIDYPDLPAAQTLVRMGLEIKKMLRGKGKTAGEEGQKDLFDGGSATGDWTFTKRD